MKKTLKLLICALLAAVLSIPFVVTASAASATSSISLSSTSIYTDKQVKVTVTYKADTNIGGWDFTLNYDPSLLQYVSGADKHTAGSCRVINVNMGTEQSNTVSFTFTFTTLAEGYVEFTTSTNGLVAEDSTDIATTEASKTLTISKEPVYVPSGVNTLAGLSVDEGKISPAFAAGTNEYSLEVDYPVKSLTVNASTTHKLASVSVSGADYLSVGENTVTVTVRAENGAKNSYIIKVTRNESPYSAEKATVNDKEYTFPIDETTVDIPDGFAVSILKYNDKDVLAFENITASVCLVALEPTVPEGEEPAEKTVEWFVYDKAAATFTPYISYSPGVMDYVILTPPEDIILPDGYTKEHINIGNNEIIAFYNSLFDERFHLVYATPVSGVPGLYVYDSLDNSFQYYMTYPGEPTKATVDELNGKISDLETEKNDITASRDELSAKFEDFKLKAFIVAVVMLALILILIVVIIIIAVKKKKSTPNDSNVKKDKHKSKSRRDIFAEDVEIGTESEENIEYHEPTEEFTVITEHDELSATEKPKRRKAVRTFSPDGKK